MDRLHDRRCRHAREGPVDIARRCASLVQAIKPAARPAMTKFAPDVVVCCEPSLRCVLLRAGEAWRALHGVPVRLFVAPHDQNVELARRGARMDLLVGMGEDWLDRAEDLGTIDPLTRVAVARNALVMARHGPRMPPMTLPIAGTTERLLGIGPFGLVDLALHGPGEAARVALIAVGLWPALEPGSVGAETTEALVAMISEGLVSVGVLYNSDVVANPDLSLAATFPGPAPLVEAALTVNARSPYAQAFLNFICDDGLDALTRAGLDIS